MKIPRIFAWLEAIQDKILSPKAAAHLASIQNEKRNAANVLAIVDKKEKEFSEKRAEIARIEQEKAEKMAVQQEFVRQQEEQQRKKHEEFAELAKERERKM